MSDYPSDNKKSLFGTLVLIALGVALVVFGWSIPSRFKSIPHEVLRDAGEGTESVADLAESYLFDGNLGVSRILGEALVELKKPVPEAVKARMSLASNGEIPMHRWGVWDPFVSGALDDVPLEDYSDQPGSIGLALSRSNREAFKAYFEESKNPLVEEILSTGNLNTYQRLFPVYSASGRPLEATLNIVALLAQSDSFSLAVKKDLRVAIWTAKGGEGTAPLEDIYLDIFGLGRLFDWGQLKILVANVERTELLHQLRYLFHRSPDASDILYAALSLSKDPEGLISYLKKFGDEGVETLRLALGYGKGSVDMLFRERLPIEGLEKPIEKATSWTTRLSHFSLQYRNSSLAAKYLLFFVGSFFCFWGTSRFSWFYRERVSSALAYTQRSFASLTTLLVLIVLSEPYLAGGHDFEGYSFSFVLPVIAQVDGEIQIIETTPTTSMETATLISISFFFLLQALVFAICLLKIREINRKPVDSGIKLRLMDNEENLFDTGLYVGIAGTCISLVLQVLGLIEANLISAYSSNLFGILCVAIVKIRLVRPYKNRLILANGEEYMKAMGKNVFKT